MKLFDSIQVRRPERNKFDLSHEKKLSFNMGFLVPIMCEEIVPGDSFRVRNEVYIRMAPMLAPIMHRVNVKLDHFFCPTRLVWNEFEDFITGGADGESNPVPPFFNVSDIHAFGSPGTQMAPGTLWDYLGLPTVDPATTMAGADAQVSALPFRVYQTIYQEYYKDQTLNQTAPTPLTSGNQSGSIGLSTTLRRSAWEKDYLTSALPFAQRGPDVNIPFGDAAVTYSDESIIMNSFTNTPMDGPNYMQVAPGVSGGTAKVPGGLQIGDAGGTGVTNGQQVRVENIESIEASGTIRDLRRSMRLQEWLELAARVGARYVELLKGFFGVRPDDARLQRPEYLGGSRQPVMISETLSTAVNFDADGEQIGNPQGNMSGNARSFSRNNGFTRTFKEHGYVMSILRVLPKTAYQQGIHRMWSRTDKFDYYWRQFANIGEQEVKFKEAYYDPTEAGITPEDTFGYQSRYAEYKYSQSTVHGDFRTSLAYWHMGRIFSDQPTLSEEFIDADPTHRIFSVEDEDIHKLYCQIYNQVDAIRPMPYYGTPTL